MTIALGRHRLSCVVLLLMSMATVASGCGSPTQPSSGVGLAGTWTGSASDSSGPGQMTWDLAQTDASFSGTLTMTDTHAGYSGRGSVSGTISGSSARFVLGVPVGGFDAPYETCTASFTGDAQVASSSMSGTYSGSNSCSGAVGQGQFTLRKPQ